VIIAAAVSGKRVAELHLMTIETLPRAAIKPRHQILAVLLLLVGTGNCYLYLGKPKRAAALAAYSILMVGAIWHGLGGWLAEPLFYLFFAAVSVAVLIAVVVDLVKTARRSQDYVLQWYNRWWVYGAVFLASAVYFNLPEILGNSLRNSVRSFTFPSGSMEPAIRVGDRGIADMRAYDRADPERGDVVVFRSPRGGLNSLWVKRIVALPGDTIQMRDGVTHVNGTPLPTAADGSTYSTVMGGDTSPTVFRVKRETLPGGRVIKILKSADNGPLDNTVLFKVPAGHYFMLGDNRDNSVDSRVPHNPRSSFGIGTIPRADVMGRLSWLFWSDDWSRVGERVK
jgi:signal peptidase I